MHTPVPPATLLPRERGRPRRGPAPPPRSPRPLFVLLLTLAALTTGLCLAAALVNDHYHLHWRPPLSRDVQLHAALQQGHLRYAEGQLMSAHRGWWRQETEALVRHHGPLRVIAVGGRRTGSLPGFRQRQATYRLTFADGYERCLWLHGRGTYGLLQPVGAGYVDCATIPASLAPNDPRLPPLR